MRSNFADIEMGLARLEHSFSLRHAGHGKQVPITSQRYPTIFKVKDADLPTENPAAPEGARCVPAPAWLEAPPDSFLSKRVNEFLYRQETNEPIYALLNVAKPLLTQALGKLGERLTPLLRRYPEAPVTAEAIEQVFVSGLASQLLGMLSRTMVLELNIARLQGVLKGETPEERYRSFVKAVSAHEAATALMLEYPILAAQLSLRADQWVNFIAEFVERLCADWPIISNTLFPQQSDPGVLTDLHNAGDRHRGGHSVLIIAFSPGMKVVYKPKPMAVDAHFQELLRWLNEHGADPSFPIIKVLDRGPYGWSEFVAAQPCIAEEQIGRFYRRQGAYLALLHVLEATDFHRDNIVAAGENPVPIDVEAIFHPRVKLPAAPIGADWSALSSSVLRTGILPQAGDAHRDGFDISGLGGAPQQLTPNKFPYWENIGTDEMKLVREQVPIASSRNRPSLNDLEVNPSDHVREIEEGFASLYRVLIKHRQGLLAADGPVLRFAEDEVRVILRPTKTYGVLLSESFHPDVLRNAEDRDALLDRLRIALDACPYLSKVVLAERDDLQNGDTPYFSTRPKSVHIWSAAKQCIPNFLDKPSLNVVTERLQNLNEQDLNLQRWIIRASLAEKAARPLRVQHNGSGHQGPWRTIDHSQLLSAACSVGDRLSSFAIEEKDTAWWIGLSAGGEQEWRLRPATLDFYDGLPGIVFFLAYLGISTNNDRYSVLARNGCKALLLRMEERRPEEMCIGAFDGWGGLIYVLSHLAYLWHDSALLERANRYVRNLFPLIRDDKHFDIIAGSAGCIGSLIALSRTFPSADALNAAKACGRQLIANARAMPEGIGWVIPKQSVPLAGFAHGAAGIAWALLQLAELGGDEQFQRAAEAAIAYERSLFDPAAGNWRDLRTTSDSNEASSKASICAWCHGAAGIAMARLAALQLSRDHNLGREINVALSTTLRTGFGHNHSLCHGDFGNVDLFLQAGDLLKNNRWHLEARTFAASVVEDISRAEYRCSMPLNVHSPGLMTGLAGIGYGLLRLANPERIPSVLTLQPAGHC